MNRDGGPVAAQSQLNPTPCLLSPLAAPAGKQLRNRMPKQTCLHRRAGVRARSEVYHFFIPFQWYKLKISAAHLKAVCADNNALHFLAEGNTCNLEVVTDTTSHG